MIVLSILTAWYALTFEFPSLFHFKILLKNTTIPEQPRVPQWLKQIHVPDDNKIDSNFHFLETRTKERIRRLEADEFVFMLAENDWKVSGAAD